MVTATATAREFIYERSERTVFEQTVGERNEDGPAASTKYARREYVRARSQNEQDN